MDGLLNNGSIIAIVDDVDIELSSEEFLHSILTPNCMFIVIFNDICLMVVWENKLIGSLIGIVADIDEFLHFFALKE